MLLAENNILLAFADKLKKYTALHLLQETVSAMKDNMFCLATDGSNDIGSQKMNPLTVRIYDVNTSRVVTQFTDMCSTTGPSGGTAESIFNKIDKVLQKFEIPWCNCVGFSLNINSTKHGNQKLDKIKNS